MISAVRSRAVSAFSSRAPASSMDESRGDIWRAGRGLLSGTMSQRWADARSRWVPDPFDLVELALDEGGVEPTPRQQLPVDALLDDRPFVEDQDQVGIADRAEPVCDHDPRSGEPAKLSSTSASVSRSRWLVASSRMANRCCWPPESPPPPSATRVSYAIGIWTMSSWIAARPAASITSSREMSGLCSRGMIVST